MMQAQGILGILFVVILIIFAQRPWQAYCTDLARHLMFKQRDKLFDLAAAGELNFEDPAYRATRSQIEGLIRFAHEATWVRFLMFAFVILRRLEGRAAKTPAFFQIEQLKEGPAKRALQNAYNECGRIMVRMVIQKSFPLTTLLGLASIVVHIVNMHEQVGRHLIAKVAQTSRDLIQQEAGALDTQDKTSGHRLRHA